MVWMTKAEMDTMEQYVGEALLEWRPHLKASTIKAYWQQVKKLMKKANKTDFAFLQDPPLVKTLVSDLAYTSQRNAYTGVSAFLSAIDVDGDLHEHINQYDTWATELNEKYQQEQKTGVISDKQSDNFITMTELEDFVKKLKRDVTFQEKRGDDNIRMVSTIFQILIRYPLRNDLAGLTLTTAKREQQLTQEDKMNRNYLVKDKDEFMIVDNVYKTSKKYGENRIPIKDAELNKILRSYIRIHKLRMGDVVFPISANYLSQLLIKYSQKYIQKNISTTMVRKIVSSHKFLDTKIAQEEHAKILGHGVETENAIYIKKAKA